MILKRKDKWVTKHCHGKDKGKTIATFETKKEALAQHRAIQISKKLRRKKK